MERRKLIAWTDKETGKEIPERQVAFGSAGSLGFVWQGAKEADGNYPSAEMFFWEGDVGSELWLAYVPGRFYAIEVWIQGFFKARVKLTVETLFDLPNLAALMERVLKRLILIQTRETQEAAGVLKRKRVTRAHVAEFVEAAFRLHGYEPAEKH